ncbi:MAG: helix-turn-helix transcriptional regulator [Bacteroidales bacterium]|nr:helix-turn-helix transcriptional regulator [Bacteroidales bacterium]
MLVEADGAPFLCQSGQVLLIPQLSPFAIRYYKNVVGYSGGFSLSILPDANTLRFLAGPLHQGFWFDEGAFVSELFNMLALSFEKGDRVFVEKGLDLLLTRIQRAKRMLSESKLPVIDVAANVGIEDQSYFSRLFKKETGMTPSAFRKKMQG